MIYNLKNVQMNKIYAIAQFLLFAFTATQAQEMKGLPDFKKAKPISFKEAVKDTISTADGRYLEMLNACEVGEYDVDMYMIRNDVLFSVFTLHMGCVPNRGFGASLTKQERDDLSTRIDTLGKGHWYAVVKKINCGYVFEYEVGKNFVIRSVWQFGCN